MSDEVPATLLEKLAEHAARIDRIADSSVATITSDVTERDGDDNLLHVHHTEARRERVSGKQISRVLVATRDGHDDQRAAQRLADEEDRKPPKKSPFAADSQQRYRFTLLGPVPGDPRLVRIGLAPRDDDDGPDLMIGEAIVDSSSGETVRLSGRAAKNPMLIDRSNFTFEYATVTPAGRMLSAMTFDFAGGIAFLKRQGQGRITFQYAPRTSG